MISAMFKDRPLFSSLHSQASWRPDAVISLIGLWVLLAWDFSGGDMQMAQWWGQASGFALRDNWWMVKVMHEGARNAGWILLLALLAGIWRPWATLRHLPKVERVSLFLSVLAALLAITLTTAHAGRACEPKPPQAVNVQAAQSPQTVQVEAVTRLAPGTPGDPGANAEIVVLTLAAYMALTPEQQMNGIWYVIPKA